ncbi:uncharacterized protein TRIADDRAFT_54696 [Trichoplax adhaerens]|uniref:Protein Lines N-terminal domain-containing protein n=1 Tax=Trichoplax adhaerens TaxID=10228 RepID=B3RSR0_TRIAD|nr:hypothetical protein TRIADDRAFT_54696 [Trichoplax adhaerens]EDV26561.1 hypothetical protein TRIADDRAFT_54696 [Trichoplax adhaerens]|eukprot:XP_002110557.1 hypothetical protein TRIADDRAFT_54696 [Trichoplax adhaerens]
MAMYDNDQTYLKTLSNISYAIINKPQDLNLVETTKLLLPIPIQDDSERLINISAKLSTITELFQHAAHPEDHLTCICNKVISEGLIPKLKRITVNNGTIKFTLLLEIPDGCYSANPANDLRCHPANSIYYQDHTNIRFPKTSSPQLPRELTVNCLKDIVDNRENLSSKYIIAMQNISLFSGFYHSARNEAGSKIGKSVMNDYACSSSLLRKLMLCLFASLRIVLSCEVNKSTDQTDEDLVFRSIESIIYYLHVFHDIVATGNPMSTSQDNCNDTTGLAKTLVNTFIDEDDSLVQIILWLLDVYSAVKIFSNSCSCRLAIALAPLETFMSQLQPDLVFILLIKYFYYDHTVLLDMLISNETNFLECFVKYLKFIIQDWDNFRKAHDSLSDTSLIANEHLADIEAINVSEHSNIEIRGDHYNETDLSQAMSVNEIHDVKHHYDISLLSSFENYSKDTENGDDVSSISSLEELYSQSISSISSSESFSSTRDCEYTLDKTMAVLIRLNLAIERLKEKDLFPYCPDALLKLLSQVEELYEAGY